MKAGTDFYLEFLVKCPIYQA